MGSQIKQNKINTRSKTRMIRHEEKYLISAKNTTFKGIY